VSFFFISLIRGVCSHHHPSFCVCSRLYTTLPHPFSCYMMFNNSRPRSISSELILHMIHEYGGGMNSQLEAIFLNVHFMLFFTAIFNALQSCVVRLLTIRKTNKSWLTTEDIEISHYVAVRKDFDRLERQLKTVNPKYMGSLTQRERQPPTDYSTSCDVPHQQQQQKQSSSSSSSSTLWKSIKESLSHLALRIRHPRLYRRRDKLLTIVRFHELRAHFIESNNLPAKFQVSTYLDRSLKSDLIDFVHISPVAWISCMATTNFIFCKWVDLCSVSLKILFFLVCVCFFFV
jgi:hypothetical protein